VSDPIEFCRECGTNLPSGVEACPSCGTTRDGIKPRPTGLKAYQPYLIGGGVVVALAVLAYFGGLFGPSGKAFCTATLNQARDYGVISPSATLASDSADSTGVSKRRSCTAKVGEETFTLVADMRSSDVKNKACRDFVGQEGCVKLYSVARSDGTMTYQVKEIAPNDTDEALAKAGLLGAPIPAPAQSADAETQTAPASGDSTPAGSMDTETTTDNSAGAPAPQGQPQ
jgi:hypothetical protein